MSSESIPPPPKKPKRIAKKITVEDEMFDALKKYFVREENGIKCLIPDCTSTVSRYQLYYFKRHFHNKHASLLKELFPEELSIEKQHEIAALELVLNAVELVTVNGYPFSILDATALKSMLSQQIQQLEQNGYKVTINRHMISQKIDEIARAITNRIRDELKDKMLSIMFDICTKRTFSVLGVSATTMINNEVIARSLGMIQLKERHRGPYLANVTEDLLKQYDVKLKQIYSGTADQAKNMTNTVRNLNLLAYNEENHPENDLIGNELNDTDSEGDGGISDDDGIRMETENQMELMNELNNEERFVELVDSMTVDLSSRNNFLSPIQKNHCCAHTLQLAINDAMNRSDAKSMILEVREMMKLLRTTVVNVKFRKLAPNCILPRQYIDIRWNSDYQMVGITLNKFHSFQFNLLIINYIY